LGGKQLNYGRKKDVLTHKRYAFYSYILKVAWSNREAEGIFHLFFSRLSYGCGAFTAVDGEFSPM
jgi:hypothetical protein